MTMENNKYTPNEIGTSNILFSIPLYQRLFEWEEDQIVQLLNDLYSSYEKDVKAPYFIGMLTAYKNKNNGKYDLVDGQQRFTVIMLMAIAFGWNKLAKLEDDKLRLSFSARTKDTEYLMAKILERTSTPKYINTKMEKGLEYIDVFLKKKEENITTEFVRQDFIDFMYNNLTFFISELPESYQTNDLNKYFESMNADGRGLENHEILKVNLLKNVSNDKQVDYTRIWNAVSEMDKALINKKYNEDSSEFFKRQNSALSSIGSVENISKYCNFFISKNTSQKFDRELIVSPANEITENIRTPKIREILQSKEAPKVNYHSTGERAIITFPEFLLQVLWLQMEQLDKDSSVDFFNVHKLQETFEKYLPRNPNKVEEFFNNLITYRVLFDYYIIRISSDDNSTAYTLNFNENENNTEKRNQLSQFQSMLYVSTTNHLWLTQTLIFLALSKENITLELLLNELIRVDNERHNSDKISLIYNEINRYWFWRLDYYLWENREKYFTGKAALDVAKNYVFRTNRSIEHISPQTPEENSLIKLDKDTMLDWFGNLAMISSGQNSSLQNRSFEVKQAHVKSFINESKNGSIESLKQLKVLDFETWNEYMVKAHGNEMIDILIESFPTDGYEEIKSELNKSKLI